MYYVDGKLKKMKYMREREENEVVSPKKKCRRTTHQAVIFFLALIYIKLWFNTLWLHNSSRPYLQYHGPTRIDRPNEKRGIRYAHNVSTKDTKAVDNPATLINGRITSGETITSILRGDTDYPSDEGTTKGSPLQFQPGSINLKQPEVLKHCYADPNIYARHFPSSDRQVTSVSDQYKLVLLLIPKSGSSTGRWIMENVLDAKQAGLNPAGNDLNTTYVNSTVITFVRDPLHRFYSQYDEVFLRFGPWMKNRNGRAWQGMKNFIHPYPSMYANVFDWDDYQNAFCPPETIPKHVPKANHQHWCSRQETNENGTLALRFEKFVEEYDGLSPWDLHLHLQVPHISNKNTGRSRRLDEIYNTERSISDWQYIVNWYGKSLPDDGMFNARSVPRRFKTSLVGQKTKKRICQVSAIDYCCLNMKLPPECIEKEVEIYCSLDRNKEGEFRIQPWQEREKKIT